MISCLPVETTHSPSSEILIHELDSSKPKSWSNSTRFAYSGSFFKLRFLWRTRCSGSGRAVELPETVYTGTDEAFVSFMTICTASHHITNVNESSASMILLRHHSLLPRNSCNIKRKSVCLASKNLALRGDDHLARPRDTISRSPSDVCCLFTVSDLSTVSLPDMLTLIAMDKAFVNGMCSVKL